MGCTSVHDMILTEYLIAGLRWERTWHKEAFVGGRISMRADHNDLPPRPSSIAWCLQPSIRTSHIQGYHIEIRVPIMSTAVFSRAPAQRFKQWTPAWCRHDTQATRRVLRINSVNTSLTRIKRAVYFFWNDDSAMEASEELSPVEASDQLQRGRKKEGWSTKDGASQGGRTMRQK
jgi:hypothetical protein